VIPKVHKYGQSFKGAAVYVLHDKRRAVTNERVEWVETLNLAVDASTKRGQDIAWRVMAATAMDADRLKAEAGVKNTGRKSKEHVMHFTLSWHPDETVSRDDMMQAARDAIDSIGGKDHQAMIVAHNDENHDHLHIVLNRVSPEDGRLLTKGRDRRKLSDWALEYERNRGTIYCKQRERNKDRRQRGDYKWYPKDKPRHIFELERGANDNTSAFKRYQTQQKAADFALADYGRDVAKRHKTENADIVARLTAGRRKILDDSRRERIKAQRTVRDEYRPQYDALADKHGFQADEIESNEQSLLGRARNRLAGLKIGSLFRQGVKNTISDAYTALASEDGARLLALKRYEVDKQALEARERTSLRQVSHWSAARKKDALAALDGRYDAEKHSLELKHDLENAKLRAEWQQRNKQRQEGVALLRAPAIDRDFDRVASADPDKMADSEDQRRADYLKSADDNRELTREEYLRKAHEQDNEPGHDREH